MLAGLHQRRGQQHAVEWASGSRSASLRAWGTASPCRCALARVRASKSRAASNSGASSTPRRQQLDGVVQPAQPHRQFAHHSDRRHVGRPDPQPLAQKHLGLGHILAVQGHRAARSVGSSPPMPGPPSSRRDRPPSRRPPCAARRPENSTPPRGGEQGAPRLAALEWLAPRRRRRRRSIPSSKAASADFGRLRRGPRAGRPIAAMPPLRRSARACSGLPRQPMRRGQARPVASARIRPAGLDRRFGTYPGIAEQRNRASSSQL